MKRIKLIPIILFLSCISNSEQQKIDNQSQTEILEVNPFLMSTLMIEPISDSLIIAHLSCKNLSKSDTFFLYKDLLPDSNNFREELFGIFSTSSFVNVPYTGKHRINLQRIVPIPQESNFLELLPGAQINFTLNISKQYDFSSLLKLGERSFAISSDIDMPAVDRNFKQIYKLDTIDNTMKPLYYLITLPQKNDIDSMRVYFTIPD